MGSARSDIPSGKDVHLAEVGVGIGFSVTAIPDSTQLTRLNAHSKASKIRKNSFRFIMGLNFPYPTLADATLDRIVHNAQRLQLQGESQRKLRSNRSMPNT